MVTPELPSDGAGSVQFTITGRIQRWDRVERCLWIDERPLWVVPGLDPVAGSAVTVWGHREWPGDRWVVTAIARDASVSS